MARFIKESFEQKRQRADGRWPEIFEELCPGMFTEALQSTGHVKCPLHGGKGDFLMPTKGMRNWDNPRYSGVACCTCIPTKAVEGFGLLQLALGLSRGEVVHKVFKYLEGTAQECRVKPAIPAYTPPSDEEKKALEAEIQLRIEKLWGTPSYLSMDSPVANYYLERKIDSITLKNVTQSNSLKWLPSYGFYENKVKVGSYPAIFGALQNKDDKIVAIHRTWLSVDCKSKARGRESKKLSESLGLKGSAIRLFAADSADCLGLAEGIETAMAAWQLANAGHFSGLSQMPVWSCANAGNLLAFDVPTYLLHTLKKIVVFADNDERGTGEKAANALKARLAQIHPHIEVDIRVAAIPDTDFNDELINVN